MLIFTIKNLRKQRNLTLKELSQRTGLSCSFLSKLERNTIDNCGTKQLEKISIVLGVNIKELFYSELDIDTLKIKLYEIIEKHGINSKQALEISQVIDLLINILNKQK